MFTTVRNESVNSHRRPREIELKKKEKRCHLQQVCPSFFPFFPFLPKKLHSNDENGSTNELSTALFRALGHAPMSKQWETK